MPTLVGSNVRASVAVETPLAELVRAGLRARAPASDACFPREAPALARACQEMAARFLRGGRLLAFGRGACATDAQHVSVEFVHPVIVGKRALPALDLSLSFGEWTAAVARPDDIALGFAPPEGDPLVDATLAQLRAIGVQTLALSGSGADYAVGPLSHDPFIHQELIEILYHTLWETVHVFLEHGSNAEGADLGEASFLYPYLGRAVQDTDSVREQVAESIVQKARTDIGLREAVAAEQSSTIASVAATLAARIEAGGKLIAFGNGGSATDANDFALDCVAPPKAYRPVPALSLALEPAILSAIGNDVGMDVVFVRQLVAHARQQDVAIAISTSGSSRNLVVALEEARRRGLFTLALLGYDGGEILRRDLADAALVVHCDYIPRIQEVQASIYHVLRDALAACRDG